MMTVEKITTNEACRQAGCSFRQLDYWIRNGVIDTIDGPRGSGYCRHIWNSNLPALRVITKFSQMLGSHGNGGLHHELARRVVDEYDLGRIDCGGIAITWDVES